MPSQCSPAAGPFEVIGLPAFNDNYIWLLRAPQRQGVVVVDPGDAAPVIDACRRQGVLPDQIWLTHHHADHTGGVADIAAWVAQQGGMLSVIGPTSESIPGVTRAVQGGEAWTIGCGLQIRVLSVPGHTRGHIAYLVESAAATEAPALFCGDVLFGLGCGRLFEGTAAQMAASLAQIRALPPQTRIYCAHEYTLMNLPFAEAVDPDNAALQNRGAEIRRKRQAGESTVPLTLAVECATNPFLRCDQQVLCEAAMLPADATPVEVFTRLRQMRDTFKASF